MRTICLIAPKYETFCIFLIGYESAMLCSVKNPSSEIVVHDKPRIEGSIPHFMCSSIADVTSECSVHKFEGS